MRRLLVVRLSALGDVVHTIPAVVSLRDALPESEIAWAVEAPYRELVEIIAGVRSVPVRVRGWTRRPIQSRQAIRGALRSIGGADAAIDFQGLIKSALVARLSGAPLRYGFDRAAIREKPALLFTNRHVRVDTSRHVVDQNAQLASAVAGLSDAQPAWGDFPVDSQGKLGEYARSIVMLPGAGRPDKQWPPERFQELGRRIDMPVVVAWGPGERDLAESTKLPLAPATDLRELAWLVRHAALVIGGDTGPLHLAAALGAKVVGLYGPTNPQRNGPYGQIEHCIDHFHLTKSMASITVDDVMNLAMKVVRS
jgi:lipopolysaccharide heptosyltransferase I